MSYKIKAYTNIGLLASKPFHDRTLAERILFDSLTPGLIVSRAYITDGKHSQCFYIQKQITRPSPETRPSWLATSQYGIILINQSLSNLKNLRKS